MLKRKVLWKTFLQKVLQSSQQQTRTSKSSQSTLITAPSHVGVKSKYLKKNRHAWNTLNSVNLTLCSHQGKNM